MRLTAKLLARTLAQIVNTKSINELDAALEDFSRFLATNSWSSESKLTKIFFAYKLLKSAAGDRQTVTTYSARKLSDEEKKLTADVAKKICGKEVEINNLIKKELIGGIVLEGYDWRYCADVKSNLENLRANLVNS